MNQGLAVWTSEDCALVLIDYKKKMSEASCPAASSTVIVG